MKVYLVLDTDNRFIHRIYTNKKDAKTFLQLYADSHTILEMIDTIHHKFPRIDEETEQRWGVQINKEDGMVTDVVRGVSIQKERIDDLLMKGTATIFVDALTWRDAVCKARKIFDNGKEENAI